MYWTATTRIAFRNFKTDFERKKAAWSTASSHIRRHTHAYAHTLTHAHPAPQSRFNSTPPPTPPPQGSSATSRHDELGHACFRPTGTPGDDSVPAGLATPFPAPQGRGGPRIIRRTSIRSSSTGRLLHGQPAAAAAQVASAIYRPASEQVVRWTFHAPPVFSSCSRLARKRSDQQL